MAYNTPSPYMEPPHEPQPSLFDNLQPKCIDNPDGDFRDSEVRGLWEDRRLNRLALKMREAEYNDGM